MQVQEVRESPTSCSFFNEKECLVTAEACLETQSNCRWGRIGRILQRMKGSILYVPPIDPKADYIGMICECMGLDATTAHKARFLRTQDIYAPIFEREKPEIIAGGCILVTMCLENPKYAHNHTIGKIVDAIGADPTARDWVTYGVRRDSIINLVNRVIRKSPELGIAPLLPTVMPYVRKSKVEELFVPKVTALMVIPQ